MKKYKTICEIIKHCEKDIKKDIDNLKFINGIDFIDIFPISPEHKILLESEALKIASIIEKTDRGNFYLLNNPVQTIFGTLKIFKVRVFDETRLDWVAAPDFSVTDYGKFFEVYKNDKRFQIIKKKTYKGLEFKTKKSLIYFLDELTTDYYNIK